jgi:hypothetical protein
MEKIELTEQEQAIIKAQREQKEKAQECAKEIEAVLAKYGMGWDIVGINPQIVIVPKK